MRGRQVALLLVFPLLMAAGGPVHPLSPARARAAFPACQEVRLSEFLPNPVQIDWNGDGAVSSADKWIELQSLTGDACDLGGWQLDTPGTGSAPYRIPPGTALAPYGYAVFWPQQMGIALHSKNGTVRLLDRDGYDADLFAYSPALPDHSWSLEAGSMKWSQAYPPTPGRPNEPGAYRSYLPLVLN